MKQAMKKMAMLLCVVTIAAGAISCENKAKKEAEEAAKQEALMKEEAARQEAEEKARLEEYIKQFIDNEYEMGYQAGYRCGANKYKWDKEKEFDTELAGHKTYYYRNCDFLKEYPSYESTCIRKYKEGWEEGWEEGRKHQS